MPLIEQVRAHKRLRKAAQRKQPKRLNLPARLRKSSILGRVPRGNYPTSPATKEKPSRTGRERSTKAPGAPLAAAFPARASPPPSPLNTGSPGILPQSPSAGRCQLGTRGHPPRGDGHLPGTPGTPRRGGGTRRPAATSSLIRCGRRGADGGGHPAGGEEADPPPLPPGPSLPSPQNPDGTALTEQRGGLGAGARRRRRRGGWGPGPGGGRRRAGERQREVGGRRAARRRLEAARRP